VAIGKVLLQLTDARTFVRNHDGIKTGYTKDVRITNPAIPLSFAKKPKSASSLVGQRVRGASAPLIGIKYEKMEMIVVVLGPVPTKANLNSVEEFTPIHG
jgi:hypothetical protein